MLLGKIHHLCDFGFCNLECKDPTFSNPVIVNMQHYLGCLFPGLGKEAFQYDHNKFHRSEIIVQQQYPVKVWLLCFLSWF